MYVLVDTINDQAFGPFKSEEEARTYALSGHESVGGVPWGEDGWFVTALDGGTLPHERIVYRQEGDTTSEWDVEVTLTANSHRASDDLMHAMDGGTPLSRVLDRWFAKETGMSRVVNLDQQKANRNWLRPDHGTTMSEGEHRDDGQCHPECWDRAVAEFESASSQGIDLAPALATDSDGDTPGHDGIPGREAYIELADEMSAEGATLDDFDPEAVEAARSYATDKGIPFPIGDVDIALDYVRSAERSAPR